MADPSSLKSTKFASDISFELFSDLTKKVTLQNLFHDGGFSNVGVSQEIIDSIPKE